MMSHVYHHILSSSTWHQEVEGGFNDLIISWNARRPQSGLFAFYVRVKHGEWSPWLCLGFWGRNANGSPHQRSVSNPHDSHVHFALEVDTVTLKPGYVGTAFEVKVECEGEAKYASDDSLWASASLLKEGMFSTAMQLPKESVVISGIPLCSQFEVPHPKGRVMCSPTSTWSAVRFLQQKSAPVHEESFLAFTEGVYDQHKHIYGNWVLNVAEAYEALEGHFYCYTARLSGLQELLSYVKKGIPVVASIKGPIEGSAHPNTYIEGHLIVVKGWNAEKKRVLCMDPAFPSAAETDVSYAIADFMQAWQRRFCLAYIFQPRHL